MPQSRTPQPVAARVQYVVAFSELRRTYPGLSLRRFCATAGLPVATFARWWRAYRQHGAAGLQPCSRRPHRSPTALPGSVLDVIRAAHRELGLGVRRLHAILTQAGRITCSPSSVYRVLRRCGALTRRPRRPKPVWTRYAKAVPGERAQLDLKYLPHGRYQLTLVDDCSRLLATAVLPARTQAAVCRALPQLLAAEFVVALRGELPGQAFVLHPQHVHGEAVRIQERRVAVGASVQADQHQRRV